MNPSEFRIRRRHDSEIPRLVEIWLAAVQATHAFLSPADIEFFLPLVRDQYLPGAAELYVAATADDEAVGFLGLAGPHIDMLFIDPGHHRRGVGRLLVRHAHSLHATLTVDVNEQNPGAVAFYQQLGFKQTGRSECDGLGKPFPLLHLALVQPGSTS